MSMINYFLGNVVEALVEEGELDRSRKLEVTEKLSKVFDNKMITLWSTEDVIDRASERGIEMSEEAAKEIIAAMDRRHDATRGINWDVIDCHIDYR